MNYSAEVHIALKFFKEVFYNEITVYSKKDVYNFKVNCGIFFSPYLWLALSIFCSLTTFPF